MPKLKKFQVGVTYSTIVVFDPNLEMPFNDWTRQHGRQGFSWRDGSVSFSTLTDYGIVKIEVATEAEAHIHKQTTRAILVPFRIPEGGKIEVGNLDYQEIIKLNPGNYSLLFEIHRTKEDEMWCRLTFIPTSEPVEPQILKADPLLSPQYPLLMEAVTA
jgi:hypothetical protein